MGEYIQYEKYSGMKDYAGSLEDIVKKEREKGNKIVLTYGIFDILHLGHAIFLNKIKEKYSGSLFVNVANDARVKYRKGPQKPINSSYNRALLLSKVEMVDYVTVYPEEKSSPAWKLASIIKPDYMIQSWPWTKEAKKELKSLLNYVPKLIRSHQHFPGTHSSKQIRKMIKNYVEDLLVQKKSKSEINPEDSDLIQSFRELSKKSRSYENVLSLISMALKIKNKLAISFSDLDPFITELTENYTSQKPLSSV
ncbi:MAG: adenylyltransferase/cytidyltransferase family protein [Nanoarchaeota archaeon]|nr:adenylyltransferase/cytidyltransferase family protein [Nanoarchaeota archaeon]